MKSTLIALDTAKLVFEVVEADDGGEAVQRRRLNRPYVAECLRTLAASSFALEVRGDAHD